MSTPPNQRTCLITGSRGYLGSCVKSRFESEGWRVVELTRKPGAEEMQAGAAIPFRLGEEIPPERLRGVGALVHCAYDFSWRSWEKIHSVNVLGAEKLFQAGRSAGVGKLIFISSISAFEDCKSLYGKAKLEIEQRLKSTGALLLRPALIYGDQPKGIVGSLVKQAKNSRVLPLMGGGVQKLYFSHHDDLTRVMLDFADGRFSAGPAPITVAHEQGWTFRSILETLARVQGNKPRFVRVPWRPVWLAIKCCELLHLPLDFRSDSLVSLMHQNPHPSFEPARKLGLQFRPFRAESLKL